MSILSSFLGGSSANIHPYQQAEQGLLGQQQALYGTLLGNYNANVRSGAYDPNAVLTNLQNDTAYQTGINTGNAAAADRTLGYRPGDSEPLLQQNAIGQQAKLAYADAANQIRNQAVDRGTSALNSVAQTGGGLLSSGINGYGQLANQSLQAASQPSGFASLLGAVTPFLSHGLTGGGGGFSQGNSVLSSTPYGPTNPYTLPYSFLASPTFG